MKIEVRELIIEARVHDTEWPTSSPYDVSQAGKTDNEQPLRQAEQQIVRKVLAQLRDEIRRLR